MAQAIATSEKLTVNVNNEIRQVEVVSYQKSWYTIKSTDEKDTLVLKKREAQLKEMIVETPVETPKKVAKAKKSSTPKVRKISKRALRTWKLSEGHQNEIESFSQEIKERINLLKVEYKGFGVEEAQTIIGNTPFRNFDDKIEIVNREATDRLLADYELHGGLRAMRTLNLMVNAKIREYKIIEMLSEGFEL